MTASPRLLIVSSYVAASRVGGAAALLALPAMGIDPVLVPTTLFGRHPGHGSPGGGGVPDDMFVSLIEGVEAAGSLDRYDAILTGYFASPAQAETAAAAIRRAKIARPDIRIVVDPIMGDLDKGLYVAPSVAEAIERRLLPLADLSTPNLFEFARSIARQPIEALGDLASVMRFAPPDGRACLVTSVSTPQGTGALLMRREADGRATGVVAETPLVPGKIPNGAGDMLAAAFAAHTLRGDTAQEALAKAVGLVHAMIARAADAGSADLPIIPSRDLLATPPRATIRTIA